MVHIHYGLILANDLTKPEDARKISKLIAPYVDGVKIGIPTILDVGVSMIKETKNSTGKIVIADFKVADIGFWNKEKNSWEGTNAKIIEKVVDAGADYIICHSIVGISSIQESIEVAHSRGVKVITLPYMTHKGAELFFGHPVDVNHVAKVFDSEGIKSNKNKLKMCKTISDTLLVLGDYLRVDGFIGPANNLEVLKRYREFTNKEIFGPGIGRQAVGKSTPKDQLRGFYQTCGEQSAAIIGSAIYLAQDPAKAAKEFKMWREEIVKKTPAIRGSE
jgi:orotidine-5'-phosphate decarboxylase